MNFEEKNSLKTPINKIIEDNTKANSEQTQKISGLVVIILILTFIIIYIKVRKNQKKIHENYKRLIQKLKEDKETFLQEKPDNISSKEDIIKKTSTKISDETVNQLIAKLDKFEQSNNFLKKDITLTSLAHFLNTNPKYLSEIIKENKSKSFNNYINSLRINYITHKLYEVSVYSQYKIKYMAEECGYASPQVFVIAFKKENGVTPSYFIEQLKKDHKTSELV